MLPAASSAVPTSAATPARLPTRPARGGTFPPRHTRKSQVAKPIPHPASNDAPAVGASSPVISIRNATAENAIEATPSDTRLPPPRTSTMGMSSTALVPAAAQASGQSVACTGPGRTKASTA